MSDRSIVTHAVNTAIASYAESRRVRITPFVDKHFSLSGAWEINKLAFGRDLVRAPVNFFWALPYFLVKAGGAAADKFGLQYIAERVGRLRPGFRTDVEKEIEWLLYSELLELPFASGTRVCSKDALLEHILANGPLAGLFDEALRRLSDAGEPSETRRILEEKLTTYIDNRKDVAELATALMTMAAANKGFGGGTIALGQTTAAGLSHALAVSNFWAGPTLGGLYYSVFPAAASTGIIVGATVAVAGVVGVISAFAGVITDPAQRALGLHHWKLRRLVDAIENQLSGKENDSYSLRDGLIARMLDLLDIVKSVVPVRT